MEHPAQFDELRETTRAVVHSHRFLVIEEEHLWHSMASFMTPNDSFHFP